MTHDPSRNIRLTIAYDGTGFHGWQCQRGFRTVQGTLNAALEQLTGERISTHASGRTDTGVHALGQVVHFHTASRHAPETFVRALNAILADDLVVRDAREAAAAFHANYSVRSKLYRYIIHDGATPELFLRRYCYHVIGRLDAAAMHRSAQVLRGTHDFHSFETDWPNRSTSVRTIAHLAVSRAGDYLWIDVEADGFLYNMVRAIAGTLIDVGRGHRPESAVAAILDARDRRRAGPTAPARGLFLVRVEYEEAGGKNAAGG